MASLSSRQIQEEFINLLSDNYSYWTEKENSQEAVPYLAGAYDFMVRCVSVIEKMGVEADNCGN